MPKNREGSPLVRDMAEEATRAPFPSSNALAPSPNKTRYSPLPDPVAFIERNLVDPDTGRPFELLPAEVTFLKHAFELDPRGRLKHPELLYAAIKKSGKTAFAAMVVLYVVLIAARKGGEAYCLANDLEQSTGRVFAAIERIVRASPTLADAAKITATKITFPEQQASITAIASDYAGAAGANPHIAVFDELWAYTSERSRRLWDEMVPPPTRRIACRLTVTYAGYTGESTLLEELHKRGFAGQQVGTDLYASPGLLAFWSRQPIAPWQTPEWLDEMRQSLRPPAYLRMIENRFVTAESTFIDMGWFDACIDPAVSPVLKDKGLSVYIGIDASVVRDSTAIVVCAYDRDHRKVRLITHRVFQPSPSDPLDFEHAVEGTIQNLSQRFHLKQVLYDPYQMAAVAQRLTRAHIPMVEYPQTIQNLTEMATGLYELFKGHNLILYPDDQLRLAISRTVASESARGWKLSKEKQSHKIDVVVALAMACHGAVENGISAAPPMKIGAEVLYKAKTWNDPIIAAAASRRQQPSWARVTLAIQAPTTDIFQVMGVVKPNRGV